MSGHVLLFPGQGAQSVGMHKDVFERFEAARKVFQAASEAIGVDLRKVCFEGPEQDLSRTDLCQPAIFTASTAVLRAVEAVLGHPIEAVAAAGLSLGEYTALVAAGALEFADAARLLHARGRYMQQACDEIQGTMYSIIGLADAQVEDACRKVQAESGQVWPANYNSPGQVVISGERNAAARAAKLCTEAGAKRAIELKVAGAFHTPLMQSAAVRLAAELERTNLQRAVFSVVANTTALPVTDPGEICKLLVRQITSPVRWTQSIQWCVAQGAGPYWELGPGRVLTGLLKRIDPAQACTAVGTAPEVEAAAQTLRGHSM